MNTQWPQFLGTESFTANTNKVLLNSLSGQISELKIETSDTSLNKITLQITFKDGTSSETEYPVNPNDGSHVLKLPTNNKSVLNMDHVAMMILIIVRDGQESSDYDIYAH